VEKHQGDHAFGSFFVLSAAADESEYEVEIILLVLQIEVHQVVYAKSHVEG
jgi:hypothetical protein